jgi:FkbM family methyltransferase
MSTISFDNGIKRIYRAIVPRKIRANTHAIRASVRRLRWEVVKQIGSHLCKQVEPGLKIKLYGDSVLCEMIYYWEFEHETREFLKARLRPGDIFLDVGANVGLYTLIASVWVGPTGHVHAFEPASNTHRRLADNVRLNRLSNVTCHSVALSDTSGQATLTVAQDGYDAWNSLGKPCLGNDLDTEIVGTVTLDDFVDQHGLAGRIRAIKIDVEGWETRVLSGGIKTLSGPDSPVLVVEFTEQAAALAGSSCSECYDTLRELGYQVFCFGAEPDRIVELARCEAFPNINVIATKNLAELVRQSDLRLADAASVSMQ